MSDRKLVLLEGNICSGKTTTGNALKTSKNDYSFIEEPTKDWYERYDENLLNLFYSDVSRWAFTFQIATFVTRTKTWDEIKNITSKNKVVIERSIFSDRYVFLQHSYELDLISKSEYQIYCDFWNYAVENIIDRPDLVVYLRTPAHECAIRLGKRSGRGKASNRMSSYLQSLENLHDRWLYNDSRVLVLDGMRQWTAEEVEQMIEEHLHRRQSNSLR